MQIYPDNIQIPSKKQGIDLGTLCSDHVSTCLLLRYVHIWVLDAQHIIGGRRKERLPNVADHQIHKTQPNVGSERMTIHRINKMAKAIRLQQWLDCRRNHGCKQTHITGRGT